MHIEVLVEDQSGATLVTELLPRVIGPNGGAHTWRIHGYKGVGRLPKGMKPSQDAAKRALLDNLPRLLAGYGKTFGIDAVVVVLNCDDRDCRAFLAELEAVHRHSNPAQPTLFRLAIEEMEAWYLGDRRALLEACPRAKKGILTRYAQYSICKTWELLADAIQPGGIAEVRRAGWPLPGQLKREWAERIGPKMDVETNASPSFSKFRDGLRGLVSPASRR